jgi:uncharacterized protein YkwD
MRGSGHPCLRIVLAAAVTASAFALGTGSAAAAADVSGRNSAEPGLVTHINAVRAAHNLPALRESSLLTDAATRHAKSMGYKGYFRHELRRKGTWVSFGKWVHWYWPGPDYTSWRAGENLAWGAPDVTPSQVVTMWMNSPPHRANLLGSWKRVGVAIVHVTAPAGYFRDYPEVTIAVAEFGKRSR